MSADGTFVYPSPGPRDYSNAKCMVCGAKATGYSIVGNFCTYHSRNVMSVSPFDRVDNAYKQGKLAGKSGKHPTSNPYPTSPNSRLARSVYLAWERGWMAAKLLKNKCLN